MTLSFYNPFIFSPQNDTLAYETNIGRSFLMKTAILMQSFQYFTIAPGLDPKLFYAKWKNYKVSHFLYSYFLDQGLGVIRNINFKFTEIPEFSLPVWPIII